MNAMEMLKLLQEKNMADGGMVDPDESMLPPVAPQVPPIGQMMTSMNQTPPTDYSFYKDISSEDRAKLAQRLMQQQNSGGNLVTSGIAGLGDAISNSYGGKNTSFQKGVDENAQKATDAKLAAFDTHRGQRLQDLQGNQEMQMNDPNSPLSLSMRETLKAQGLKVPSQMPASAMLKIAGPLGEFAAKQATLAIEQGRSAENVRHNKETESIARTGQAQSENEKAAARTLAEQGKKLTAAKGLQDRPWYQKAAELVLPDSDATKEMRSQITDDEEVNHGIPDLGSTFNGGKVKKVTRLD